MWGRLHRVVVATQTGNGPHAQAVHTPTRRACPARGHPGTPAPAIDGPRGRSVSWGYGSYPVACLATGLRYNAMPMSQAGPCTICRRRKDKLHRSRATGRLVCPACADRRRLRTDSCVICGALKLLQARGRCFACYKREWRARRSSTAAPLGPVAHA